MSRSTHECLPTGWTSYPFWAIATEKVIIGRESEGLLSVYLDRGVIPYSEGGGLVHKPAESLEKYQLVEAGDFVMNNQQAWRGSVGVSKHRGIVSPAYLVFSLNRSKLLPEYAAYMFRDKSYVEKYMLSSLSVGDIQRQVKWNHLRKISIHLPSKDEQQKIVRHLDRETTRIDSLIDKRIRFNNLLNEKLIAMATLASEEASSKKLRLGKVVDVIARPVSQETSRTYTKLGLFNRGRGIFTKDATETEDMGDSDFFWVKEGDLIISGQFAWEGAVAIADKSHEGCVVSHRFPIIKGKPTIALTEYIFSILLTDFGNFILNDCSRGSAGRNRPLNLEDLLKWKISVPPLAIQEKIANFYKLRKHLSKLVSEQIRLLEEHRSALITAAVTGKIDVRKLK